MAQIFDEDEDVIAAINIVPFVDVVLVLLIIFMITSSAIVRASLTVDLPTAANADAAVNATLNIVLQADGEILLDGNPVSRDQLSQHLERASWQDDDVQAVISADRTIDYGRVVDLIDLVKANGVETFALNIQRAM